MSTSPSDQPSILFRQQINNLAARMCEILDKTASVSQGERDRLDKAQEQFKNTEREAYEGCRALESARSVATEEVAIGAINGLITSLVEIKNETHKLAQDFQVKNSDLLLRFQGKLDRVEMLMNASMRSFMHPLREKESRQALETLERWAELYRHGLQASGNIPESGEKWLAEAHRRLDLTARALKQLDIKNEAIASDARKQKDTA